MADEKDPNAPDPAAGGEAKRDLRYTSQESHNVRIDRSLDNSGHLTRGDKTKMSVLNFSSRHQARTERDPDFEFRPPPAKKPATEAAPAEPTPAPPPAEPAAEDPTLMGKVKRLFGL
jgi:hypothetical protein